MTIRKRERTVEILFRLSELLVLGNANSAWGRRLLSLAKRDALSAEDLRLQVKGLYGGMGSINDIVLFCSDGTVDRKGSEEFDTLRAELYNLVRSAN